ncbi:Mitochondrial distribution and morphology protein 12 [Coemansia spiralis]|uniref:Mitochondrial distribution and morphology protein 12 n=2 Tax=Coemansia TaxID=4863 RepID=A0A9W8G7N1_9FUNG|nr:hypothetical protein BX070DRAFT_59808 [Coemansia spiralis]KAJ1991750.1 Mitochondrial distribution and morphology protein 12 [Coemansia umbellata]KAJ2621745.1 Mitochondrial distribution and morphology protein 12 [Coemansia sp. RSA 1358]KAJ2677499.1 Mitochondrial distribution and morphology protein 12 [Coemansia spiralis]
MSFTIYWEKLDKKVAQSVQSQINLFFETLDDRPSFLGPISVESLDFGSVAPYLEITDLTEPYPEFYLATEEDANTTSSVPASAKTQDYQGVDDDLESALSQLPDRPLSQATVRSYFGTHMDNMLGSGALTPVPRIWTSRQLYHQQQQPIVQAGQIAVERSEDDMQLLAKVSYCGDMSIMLKTELQLNYQATQFVSLPVTLHITKIEFSAFMVIAYLTNRINFCFLEPEPPRTSLLDSFSIRTEIGDSSHHVLKNVEKLECFITEQLRKAIDEDFVFPSYHSFEID